MIFDETENDLAAIKNEKGNIRRLTMDLLFRHGGLRGPEIGAMFEIGYTAVSQERKRLRESGEKDREFANLLVMLENILSTMKI